MVAEGHILAMQRFGLQYAVYWQLCCNEYMGSDASVKNLRGEQLRDYVFTKEDFNGFYLIKPDGTKTETYEYLKSVFQNADTKQEGR